MARTKKIEPVETAEKQSKEELEKATEFFASHPLQEYAGKYVALIGDNIITTGKNPRDVYKRAVKKGSKVPLIARVSAPEEHIW